MKVKKYLILSLAAVFVGLGIFGSCTSGTPAQEENEAVPFLWENANVYFLLTDRFYNGDPTNDVNFDRSGATAKLRGFEGGDIAGIIQKIEEGYFDELGITAIWMTPYFEQIHGGTDEGTGITYGYHGYWIKDWTSLDPNFGTEEELLNLVETAHTHGIRIIMDVIINHTGPVTDLDPVWPEEWVRTDPKCDFRSYETTVTCTLVENLPDIRTESNGPVDLPPSLMEKWEKEGRLQKELEELDNFFERTGHPRAPRYYIIKWLTDFIRKYGIDGYRLDTAKHTEEGVWSELGKEAGLAFEQWKEEHPDKVLDSNEFYMVAEVYGYNITTGRNYSFGDREVDFFNHGIHSLINFDFKSSANQHYETLFSTYSELLHNELKGKSVLNYISSHDDGGPFDRERTKPLEAATKLLLAPGASQVYYGDESCRELIIPGTEGDANLRGFMNWEEIETQASRNGYSIEEVMEHYQKLGQFRRDHPSVGAGEHKMLSEAPYIFTRSFSGAGYTDRVVVGLDLEPGEKSIEVGEIFEEKAQLLEYYSGQDLQVKKGKVTFSSPHPYALLGIK